MSEIDDFAASINAKFTDIDTKVTSVAGDVTTLLNKISGFPTTGLTATQRAAFNDIVTHAQAISDSLGAIDTKANAGGTVVPPGVPTVASVSPSSGPAAGGTSVTVSGTGFTGATGVAFDGAPGNNLIVASDTSLTVTTPAHAAGPASVQVATSAGLSAVNTMFSFT